MHQFNLVDVNFVNIEHRAAIQGDTIDLGDIEMNRTNLLEYWEGGQGTDGNYDSADDTMNKRWGNVEENRLKIRFKHAQMSLFLRYMSDLKDMEDKSKVSLVAADDSNCLMNHIGAETKIWCRTIARCVVFIHYFRSVQFGSQSQILLFDLKNLCADSEGRTILSKACLILAMTVRTKWLTSLSCVEDMVKVARMSLAGTKNNSVSRTNVTLNLQK